MVSSGGEKTPHMSTVSPENNKEELFRLWWLRRFLPINRTFTAQLSLASAPILTAYVVLTVLVLSRGDYVDVIPQSVLAWCAFVTFASWTRVRSQWTVISLSHVATLTMITCSSCLILTGFTRPVYDHPTPFVMGLLVLMWSGSPTTVLWPLWITHFWVPMLVPLVFVIANMSVNGWSHPSLPVNTFLTLQIASQACYFIQTREINVRAHFTSIRILFEELARMEHVLSLLLPSSLILKTSDDPMGRKEYVNVIDATIAVRNDHFAESFEDASVLMAEVFFESCTIPAEARLQMLDHIFLQFDTIVAITGVLKIETIAGVYVVAANIANMPTPNHVEVLIRMAFQFLEVIPEIITFFHMDTINIHLKVGINSGFIIGGVIGKLLPRYRIFGDTVNTASRMETSSHPGHIQLSPSAAAHIISRLPNDLVLVSRGNVEIKGKGIMETFFVFNTDTKSKVIDDSFRLSPLRALSKRVSFDHVPLDDDPTRWQDIVSKIQDNPSMHSAHHSIHGISDVETQHPQLSHVPPNERSESSSLDTLLEGTSEVIGPVYYQYRYTRMWHQARVVRVIEPLSVAVVCTLLAWNAPANAINHVIEAAVFGALLIISFTASLYAVWVGNRFPTYVSWSTLQKCEMLPVILHASILSHWSRLLGVVTTTPVWTLLFTLGNDVYFNNIMRPGHSAVTTAIIFVHQCVCVAVSGEANYQWIDIVFFIALCTTYFTVSFFINLNMHEHSRRSDLQILNRTQLLRDMSQSIMHNFLPVPVLSALHNRDKSLNNRSMGGTGGGADILAWEFNPAFVLQSDLVGFTALGSRISPRELCDFLHSLFSRFDDLAFDLGVNKIETVGDAYIAATGCIPGETRGITENALALASMAIKMQRMCASMVAPDGSPVVMRIGLHCGPIVGGVVGGSMLRYHLFGSTMDVLTQLEQSCKHGNVHMSRSFAMALRPSNPLWQDSSSPSMMCRSTSTNNKLYIKRRMSRLFDRQNSITSDMTDSGSSMSGDSVTGGSMYGGSIYGGSLIGGSIIAEDDTVTNNQYDIVSAPTLDGESTFHFAYI